MYELITKNFKGSTITLGITGVPVVITGEVFDATPDYDHDRRDDDHGKKDGVVGLRLAGGNKVYIPGDLIAFFY